MRIRYFVAAAALVAMCIPAHAATNLPFGTVTTGTIASAAQVNHYTFEANTGDVVSFSIVGNGISPEIQVFTSGSLTAFETGVLGGCDGNVLAVNTNGAVVLPASPGGTYDVWISDCATTNTGSYSIYAQRLNNPAGAVNLPLGQITSGSIATIPQSNTYTFIANAGDYVNFVTVAANISPALTIYNPDGKQFGQSYLGGCDGSVMEWNQVQFKTAGKYTLLIGDCAATDTGQYSLYFQRTNNPAGPVSSMLWGQVQSGSIASVPKSEVYSFEGTANDVMDFTIDANGISPALVLYDSSGYQLGQSYLGGCDGSNLEWNNVKIASTGTYHLFVKDCSDTNTGTYTLSSQCAGTCLLPAPTLTSLSPNNALAGSGGLTLTVNGSNFVNVESNSVAQWAGADLTTTWKSITQMTAAVPGTDTAVAGLYPVTVLTPAPGGGISPDLIFTVNNPPPTLTSISPTSATAGGPALKLTLTGKNFVQGSAVQWNGNKLDTTYVSAAELTAYVPAADIATAGTASVTVNNPAPGGGTTAAQTFTIDNPVPATTSLSPTNITAGSAAFPLTIKGSNFVSGSVVMWNSTSLTPASVSPGQIQVTVPASAIANAGPASVTVFNPAPGGGTSKPALNFTINPTAPTTTSLSPASAILGSPAFTLTVKGTNFISGANASVVKWNGSSRTTTYVSPTQLKAAILKADLLTAGTVPVTVTNPVQGGGTSNAQTFTIDNPVPVVAAPLVPPSTAAGGAAFTLTVNGAANFVSSSVVNWNGSPRVTTFVSATQLTAAITAADIAVAGSFPVTVTNPMPGGGASNAVPFTVNNPKPVLTAISPASIIAGGSAFTLTATGSNFVASSVVRWRGVPLSTTYVSSTELQAAVPAGYLLDGAVNVTILNPTPGGGVSATQTLTIDNPVPVVMSLSPTSIAAGSAGFTLTVNGFNFNEGAVVKWNGSALPTVLVSDTQLQAPVPSQSVAAAGSAAVTVANPAPSPSPSNAVTFTIQ